MSSEPDRRRPTLILGSGPTACALAVTLARRGTSVSLAFRQPAQALAPRIDAVPLQILASLIELGLYPAALKVANPQTVMLRMWDTDGPIGIRTPPKVHLDRQVLEAALWELAADTRGVSIDPEAHPDDFAIIFDATGRRARTAARVCRPTPEWVARLRCFEGRFTEAQAGFHIAALPNGYVYRLGTADRISLGLVAPTSASRSLGEGWREELARTGVGWMVDDLPETLDEVPGRGGACSLQWAETGRTNLVGDAAFAPDILAAQGLSRGLTLGVAGARDVTLDRHMVAAHISALRESISLCRWRSKATWRRYDQYLAACAPLPPAAEAAVPAS